MTTLSRSDPRLSVPLAIRSAQPPLRSEGGKRGNLPWLPASTGEQTSGAACASLACSPMCRFLALIAVGLLEVCQTGQRKELGEDMAGEWRPCSVSCLLGWW